MDIFYWLGRSFYGFSLMGDEISEYTSDFLWDHFAGRKMPANNILYNILRVPAAEKEEERSSIQQKKNMVAAGIEP
jgi:hypothetical protein